LIPSIMDRTRLFHFPCAVFFLCSASHRQRRRRMAMGSPASSSASKKGAQPSAHRDQSQPLTRGWDDSFAAEMESDCARGAPVIAAPKTGRILLSLSALFSHFCWPLLPLRRRGGTIFGAATLP
jgi:hypothetical protein